MNKLTLNDSQHAQPQGPNGGFQRSAYIPPHARNSTRGPAPAAAAAAAPDMNGAPAVDGGDVQNSAWAAPQAK